MSLRARLPLLVAVFFTFACVGLLVDVGHLGVAHPVALAALVVFSGLIAVSFALIGTVGALLAVRPDRSYSRCSPRWLDRIWPSVGELSGEALRGRLRSTSSA